MSSSRTPNRVVVAAADGVVDTLVGIVWVSVVASLVGAGVGTLVIGVGFFVLAFAVIGIGWFGGVERRRAAAVYGLYLPAPDRARTPRRGWLRPVSQAWLDVRGADFWRGVGHLLATFALGLLSAAALTYLIGGGLAEALSPLLPSDSGARLGSWSSGLPHFAPVVAVPFGLAYLALGLGLLMGCYHAHRALTRGLLGVSDAEVLRTELKQSAERREGAVRVATSDRRHIERDLHDGVQPQLVNVGMLLDLARTKLDADPAAARALLDEAHAGTKTAISDLRQLGRGIHPAILTDSGLDAALSALVARSTLPTTLDVRLDRRCGPDAEAAVYFAVSEALANAAKHAGATACSVRVALHQEATPALVAEVTDNGRGGARLVPQGGLAGLTDRLTALGGRLDVRSGAASGTTVTAVVPCA